MWNYKESDKLGFTTGNVDIKTFLLFRTGPRIIEDDEDIALSNFMQLNQIFTSFSTVLQKKDVLSEECRKQMKKSMVLMVQDFEIMCFRQELMLLIQTIYAVSQVDETTEGENAKNYSCILSNF